MTKGFKYSLVSAAVAAALTASGSAYATNGMSMEAYGARAGGMGGAAMGYDSGNSAVMNNPATLSLMKENSSRFGAGLTILQPDVESEAMGGMVSTESAGDSYLMPSISFIKNSGRFTYGAAVLAQGGMGTEYGEATPMSQGGTDLFSGGMSMMGNMVDLSGREIRSEVGFGRAMAPLAVKVNDKLSVAAQLDLVWVGMDIQMDVDGATFADMAFDTNPNTDFGTASGSMVDGFQQAQGMGMIDDVHWARFDFSNNNDFTGEAFDYGFGGKLGFHYKVNDKFSFGAAYHTETQIGDLEAGDATVSFDGEGMAFGGGPVDVKGEIEVLDFQWPATFGIGMAYNVNDKFMLAADIKQLMWNDVLEDFKVKFTADADQSNPVAAQFANSELNASFKQDWDDQTVYSIGGQYKVTPKLALRLGVNIADNPVPDTFLNPLFPAIVEEHYMGGIGYAFSQASQIGVAFSYAPEVEQTNSQNGVKSTHSQTTWRMNYVHNF